MVCAGEGIDGVCRRGYRWCVQESVYMVCAGEGIDGVCSRGYRWCVQERV